MILIVANTVESFQRESLPVYEAEAAALRNGMNCSILCNLVKQNVSNCCHSGGDPRHARRFKIIGLLAWLKKHFDIDGSYVFDQLHAEFPLPDVLKASIVFLFNFLTSLFVVFLFVMCKFARLFSRALSARTHSEAILALQQHPYFVNCIVLTLLCHVYRSQISCLRKLLVTTQKIV